MSQEPSLSTATFGQEDNSLLDFQSDDNITAPRPGLALARARRTTKQSRLTGTPAKRRATDPLTSDTSAKVGSVANLAIPIKSKVEEKLNHIETSVNSMACTVNATKRKVDEIGKSTKNLIIEIQKVNCIR